MRTPDVERFVTLLAGAGMSGRRLDGTDILVQAPTDRVGELAAAHGVVLHRLTETMHAAADAPDRAVTDH